MDLRLYHLPFLLLFLMSQIIAEAIAAERDALGRAVPSSENADDGNISIYNPVTEKVQGLPASLTTNWPTWVLYFDGDSKKNKEPQLVRVPLRDEKDDGYADPVSYDSLWIPVDLEYPQMRLALGLHVKDGIFRQIMPAIDLSFGRIHHNRGMCSMPRAREWIDFSSEDWDAYELVVLKRKLKKSGPDDGPPEVVKIGSLKPYLNRAIEYLTTSAPDAWKEGSHIVNVVLDDDDSSASDVLECPKVSHELIVNLKRGSDTRGRLSVKVSGVQAGSKSDFLPEVYKPLFEDKNFQRKSYFDYLKKKEATQSEMKEQAAQAVKKAKDNKEEL